MKLLVSIIGGILIALVCYAIINTFFKNINIEFKYFMIGCIYGTSAMGFRSAFDKHEKQ